MDDVVQARAEAAAGDDARVNGGRSEKKSFPRPGLLDEPSFFDGFLLARQNVHIVDDALVVIHIIVDVVALDTREGDRGYNRRTAERLNGEIEDFHLPLG